MSNNPDLIARAREMAISLHDACGHKLSNGRPYWEHPERVVAIVAEHGRSAEIIAAAWLHDIPEDCPRDLAGCEQMLLDIGDKFGPVVAGLVREVTNFFLPGASMEEKQARLREHARHMSPDAKWIKLADRLDNIADMFGWPMPKKLRYVAATELLLAALRPFPPGTEPIADAIQEHIDRLKSA